MIRPSTGGSLGSVRLHTPKALDEAVNKAEAAFNQWAGRTLRERAQVLFNYRHLLRDLRRLFLRGLLAHV